MIYYPSKSDSLFTRRKSKVIIGFCWLLPLLFLTPSLLGVYGKHGVNCVTRSCTIVEQDGRTPKNIFLFTGLTLPCAVLVITNFMIFSKVWHTSSTTCTMMKQFWNRSRWWGNKWRSNWCARLPSCPKVWRWGSRDLPRWWPSFLDASCSPTCRGPSLSWWVTANTLSKALRWQSKVQGGWFAS